MQKKDSFMMKYPTAYIVLVALLGALVITAGIDLLLLAIGGPKLMKNLGTGGVILGGIWFFFHYTKARVYEEVRDRMNSLDKQQPQIK